MLKDFQINVISYCNPFILYHFTIEIHIVTLKKKKKHVLRWPKAFPIPIHPTALWAINVLLKATPLTAQHILGQKSNKVRYNLKCESVLKSGVDNKEIGNDSFM